MRERKTDSVEVISSLEKASGPSEVHASSELREQQVELCRAARTISAQGLIVAASGNLSFLSGDSVWATPRGTRKGELGPESLCHCRRLSRGQWEISPQASSEIAMHLAIYDTMADARAVVHAHPIVATVLGAMRPVPSFALTIEGGACLGPISVVNYIRPGGQSLANAVAAAVGCGSRVVLLTHHGAVTWGDSIEEALNLMETLEHVAKQVQVSLSLGQNERLPEREVAEVREMLGFPGELPRDPFIVES